MLKNEAELECERLLFDYGKQVLGKTAGGLISRLLKEKGLGAARIAIKMAAEKSDPREYIGAVLREKKIEPSLADKRPFIEIDTPQWIAWSKLRHWPQTDHRVNGRIKRGWWFESEWPSVTNTPD